LHPIDTSRRVVSATKKLTEEGPVKLSAEFIKSHQNKIRERVAQKNHLCLNNLHLKESLGVLKELENSIFAGEAALEVGTYFIGAEQFVSLIKEIKIAREASLAAKSIRTINIADRAVKDSRRIEQTTEVEKALNKTKIAGSDGLKISEESNDGGAISKTAKMDERDPGKMNIERDVEKKQSHSGESDSHMDADGSEKASIKKKIRGDGPEDQAFDKNKIGSSTGRGDAIYDEGSFRKGNSGKPGRKPTPDGLSVDHVNKWKTYWEDKRPSECENNSWRSPYDGDPIQKHVKRQ